MLQSMTPMTINGLNKLLIIIVLTSSCSETTRLDSDALSTAKERVEILKKEIQVYSEIQDTEFELFNVNGFRASGGTSMPGASSSDYKFVIKVDTADINKWKEGMVKLDTDNYDDNWTKEIIRNRPEIGASPRDLLIIFAMDILTDGVQPSWSIILKEYCLRE